MTPVLQTLPAESQRRLDQLLDGNSEGTISPEEKAELTKLVAEAEQLMVTNARQLAEFARTQSPQPPATAVPVTVWISPHHAES